MQHFLRLLGGVVLMAILVSVAHGDPSTQPSPPPVAPATQPFCDVYLVPFAPLGQDNSLDWAGKAVQQNLLTDLARARFQVVTSAKPIENPTDARVAAQLVGARFTLTGTYQVADALIRFNAQLLDTATGNVVGGLTATGAPRDLFNLEDALSAQAIEQLTHPGRQPVETASKKNNTPLAPALQPAAVAQIIQPVAVTQAGSTSAYDGSALQQYVDANRTPSTDYAQQVQNAQDRATYGYGYNNLYPYSFSSYSYGLGYPGYGYGFIYSVPFGGYGFHYGTGWGHGRSAER
jgi:TolB-like protein